MRTVIDNRPGPQYYLSEQERHLFYTPPYTHRDPWHCILTYLNLPNALRPWTDASTSYATVLGALAAAAGLGVPRVRGLAETS